MLAEHIQHVREFNVADSHLYVSGQFVLFLHFFSPYFFSRKKWVSHLFSESFAVVLKNALLHFSLPACFFQVFATVFAFFLPPIFLLKAHRLCLISEHTHHLLSIDPPHL